MNHFKLTTMLLLCLICGMLNVRAQSQVSSFEIRAGTLEYNVKASRRYVFKWDDHEEVFDLSLHAFSNASGKRLPGLPDLKEFGFKTKSGLICEFGTLSIQEAAENFAKLHPNEKATALLFEGLTGEKLEITLQGVTPVYRIDLKIDGEDVTLWRNRPMKAESHDRPKTEDTEKSGAK